MCVLLIPTVYCKVFPQCGCPGNTSEIGLANLNELVDNTSLTGNNFFVNLLYKYTFADRYFNRDINIGEGPIDNITSNFLNLRLTYKFENRWIIESDIGYLINRKQEENLGDINFNSTGPSDLTFYGRYIFLRNSNNNIEFSGGSGVKIPLTKGNVHVPQNIQPSTGAYAILSNLYLKKYFWGINGGLIIGNRSDYNFKNKWNYQYGWSSITSLVFLHNTSNMFNIGAELRCDYRAKDYDYEKNERLESSGLFALSLSPMIRILTGKFIFGVFFNYPFYQYYNGSQLANTFSLGLNASFATNIGF
jgi:hypothetical protein